VTARVPRVTVLLPVYNGERHLRAAIDSVFAQTFDDFELLIVDDGSTDGSLAIVRSYTDPRVRLVARGVNLGLVATLNEGLGLARGEFIARQDADDLLRPERLATQVRYLDAHPSVAAVGAAVQLLTDDGRVVGSWAYPGHAITTRWALLFNSPLAHSATTFRAARIRELGGYSGRLPHVEDYELWSRLVLTDEVLSVPDVLQGYRLSEEGVSRRQEARQMGSRLRLARENMTQLLGHDVTDEALEAVIGNSRFAGQEQALAGLDLITELWRAFLQAHPMSPDITVAARDLYFHALLGLLARVPTPMRQRLVLSGRAALPSHPAFLAKAGKLLLKVWL